MRILFKKEEERIDGLLESQHNQLNLYKGKVKKLETERDELLNQNEDLQVKLVSANGAKGGYIKKINELKANLEEAHKKAAADKELIKHLKKELEEKQQFEKKLEEQRNFYLSKLEEANKKIENYKKDALSNRVKPTIQEYDNRLKYRRNKNKGK